MSFRGARRANPESRLRCKWRRRLDSGFRPAAGPGMTESETELGDERVRRPSARHSVPPDRRSVRNVPRARSRQDRDRRSRFRHRDQLRPTRPGDDRRRRVSQGSRRDQGQPRAAALRREPREAVAVVRHLAARRRRVPAQHRDQREGAGGPRTGREPGADPLPQGHRLRRAGRRLQGAAGEIRRVVGGRRQSTRRTSASRR